MADFQGDTMEQQTLTQGTVLADRFEIDSLSERGPLGDVYKARDTTDNKPISLRLMPRSVVGDDEAVERLRTRVKNVSSLAQRNIQAVYGMGLQDDGSIYIASEWIEGGLPLRKVFKKRAESNKKFSFKGAYNIIGHVCNALTAAQKATIAHGTLSPSCILVNSAGRVKIGGWELPSTIAASKDNLDKVESVFWAPEIIKGDTPDHRSDIYSLGALFYELITGTGPQRPLKAPSLLGFTKDVDTVVARCMAAGPAQRFDSAASVKQAIADLVQSHKVEDTAAEDDDLGIDIDIVVSESIIPPPNHKKPQKSGMLGAPGLPPPPGQQADVSGSDDMGRVSNIDMGALLGSLGKSESAHWMVQKGKFDHGPFSNRELVQQIIAGDVLGKHSLLDMDTGVRKKVRNWKHFDEYLEQYRIKKKQREEALALEKTKRSEKRGTAFTMMVVLGVIAGVAIIGGGFWFGLKPREEKRVMPEDMVSALESGEIKLKTRTGKVGKKGKGRRGKGRKGSGGGGGGGGYIAEGMSAEEAMNVQMELDLNNNGGQQRLTPDAIARILDRKVRRFLPCMSGGATNRVDVEFVVLGDGRVMGVTVKQGSSKLKRCVESKIRSTKFPASSAPRTAASWYFEVEW